MTATLSGLKAAANSLLFKHPYYPTDLTIPGVQPLVLPFELILAIFFGSCVLLAISAWVLSGRARHLTAIDRVTLCWWLITGVIHFLVEGTVVANSKFYADTSGNPLSEIWKEYAKADSRYITRDSFVISMEAVTAFLEGPLCFVIVYGLVKRLPWRHTLSIIVAVGQIYGDVLYFMTTFYEGAIHSRPEPLYFWFYLIIVNSIWIVVPLLIIVRSWQSISTSLALSDRPARKGHKST